MAAGIIERIKENIGTVIVGRTEVIDLVLASFAAGGHVLLEDLPGTGKTVLAKSLARSMDLIFSQVLSDAGVFKALKLRSKLGGVFERNELFAPALS